MIAIVGLGVIGGSYAMALRRAGYDQVCAIDQDEMVRPMVGGGSRITQFIID